MYLPINGELEKFLTIKFCRAGTLHNKNTPTFKPITVHMIFSPLDKLFHIELICN